jgi:hypothetical protein
VLEAVKVWPGKLGARRKVGTTANLDSFCARRHQRAAGRDEETGFRSNKETDEGQKMRRFANSLTKKAPYKETALKERKAVRQALWGLSAAGELVIEIEPVQ